jgi:hypothetical protein
VSFIEIIETKSQAVEGALRGLEVRIKLEKAVIIPLFE